MSVEILSWNVNGIRAVAGKKALQWIDERRPDILCLQEIKATASQFPDELFATNYATLTINGGERKG